MKNETLRDYIVRLFDYSEEVAKNITLEGCKNINEHLLKWNEYIIVERIKQEKKIRKEKLEKLKNL